MKKKNIFLGLILLICLTFGLIFSNNPATVFALENNAPKESTNIVQSQNKNTTTSNTQNNINKTNKTENQTTVSENKNTNHLENENNLQKENIQKIDAITENKLEQSETNTNTQNNNSLKPESNTNTQTNNSTTNNNKNNNVTNNNNSLNNSTSNNTTSENQKTTTENGVNKNTTNNNIKNATNNTNINNNANISNNNTSNKNSSTKNNTTTSDNANNTKNATDNVTTKNNTNNTPKNATNNKTTNDTTTNKESGLSETTLKNNTATNKTLVDTEATTSNNSDCKIIVTGSGKVCVKPDTATIKFAVNTLGESTENLESENTQTVNNVISKLEALNISKTDIKSVNYSMFKRYDYSNGEQVFLGYEISNNLEITTKNIDNITNIISALTENGVNEIYTVEFSIEDNTTAYNNALKNALENAKSKAQVLSENKEISVCKVIECKENHFNLETAMYNAKTINSDNFNNIMQNEICISTKIIVEFCA